MAKQTTVHTEAEPIKLLKIVFQRARIAEVKLSDASTGFFKFHVKIGGPSILSALCKKMSWQVPDIKTTKQGLEGKLQGGHFTLLCDTNIGQPFEIEIPFKIINGFEILRLELEAKKGKGFRRELRFSGTFDSPEGAATFESYMNRTANAEGTLTVSYLKEATQPELEGLTEAQQTFPPED
jgi:hypothetical protein